jgi:2-methylcitrate dehydratase PrpD
MQTCHDIAGPAVVRLNDSMETSEASVAGSTAMLAARAAALRYEHLTEQACTVARHCMLDWFGVTLAARGEPLVKILLEQAYEDGGNPQATLIGVGDQFSLEQAALINGAMSHAMEYDDVVMPMRGHPTVTILPAVLALAEYRRLNGRRVVEAFVAGFELACRLGRIVNLSHYADGWHATATIGTFAAAAAASNLLRLDAHRTAHALGIAGTQAAGLKSAFGTMCKPLHAGRAAATGLKSALLAERGFTGNPAIVECDQGFADTQSTCPKFDEALIEPPGGFYIVQALFKYHASCYLTHSAVEAARRMRTAGLRDPDEIAEIIVRVDGGHLRICNIAEPQNATEIKFSLRAMTALALLGENTSSERLFHDGIATRPELIALWQRVRVEQYVVASHTLSEVEVRLKDGRVFIEACDVGIPDTDLVNQGIMLQAKFDALSRPILGSASASLRERIKRIDTLTDIKSLLLETRPDAMAACSIDGST